MKKLMILALVMSMTGMVCADAFQAGGDRLTALQNNDGGWDWPLDNGNPATGSADNTIGPIAMGLAQAYKQTGSATQLAALQKAGGFLLNKIVFSPSDGYIAAELDNVFGTTAYTSYVKANFYDKLATGTYVSKSGLICDTATYVNSIRTSRSGSQANMAAWDIGMGLYAADLIGADTTAWLSATKAEIDELDSANYYDVIGLAGAVFGLASAGVDYDPTSGSHAAASSINDLAAILAGYQLATGGFTWNANFVIEGNDNETIQETAYAVLALSAFGNAYNAQLAAAYNYLLDVQLGTGGWEGYAGDGENNEITGEALWAMTVPEPATMVILGLGALLSRKFKRA